MVNSRDESDSWLKVSSASDLVLVLRVIADLAIPLRGHVGHPALCPVLGHQLLDVVLVDSLLTMVFRDPLRRWFCCSSWGSA